ALLVRPKALGLIALTAGAYLIILILTADLWRRRLVIGTRLVVVAAGCALWLLSYSLIFHAWLWPSVTKYYVVTLPPFVTLLVLGAIGAQGFDAAKSRREVALVAALVTLVFAVNFWGGILPRLGYAQKRLELETRRDRDFHADDLFVSCESGIDPIFPRLYRGGDEAHHVSVKNEFVKRSTPEAVAAIRERIARQLEPGGPLFGYHFLPPPHSLIPIHHSPPPAR